MSEHVSRRTALKAAGVGGLGLAGAGAAGQALGRPYRAGGVSTAELARLPRVPDGVRPTDRQALGRDDVLGLPTAPAPAVRLVEVSHEPGEGLAHLALGVRQFALEFVCDPRVPNLLIEGVSRLTYEVVEVAWQAGEGWPVYRTRSPHAEPAIGLRYAGVPRHQIVVLDDRAVYVGNPGAFGVIDGIQGPVRVDVNGAAHGEHRGYYKVLITGIA